ncbi:Protein of unknown function [Lactobacillus delbrueckii subsp. lactis]|nr:Protein of unknown function [Lactobacillus delbrueckii subsp. lactis]
MKPWLALWMYSKSLESIQVYEQSSYH